MPYPIKQTIILYNTTIYYYVIFQNILREVTFILNKWENRCVYYYYIFKVYQIMFLYTCT